MLGRFADKFGRLIWSQPRDMNVFNYEKHIVYSIYENSGYRYIVINKSNNTVEWIQHLPAYQKPSTSSVKWNQAQQLKDC